MIPTTMKNYGNVSNGMLKLNIDTNYETPERCRASDEVQRDHELDKQVKNLRSKICAQDAVLAAATKSQDRLEAQLEQTRTAADRERLSYNDRTIMLVIP
jgi:hypothetical protein